MQWKQINTDMLEVSSFLTAVMSWSQTLYCIWCKTGPGYSSSLTWSSYGCQKVKLFFFLFRKQIRISFSWSSRNGNHDLHTWHTRHTASLIQTHVASEKQTFLFSPHPTEKSEDNSPRKIQQSGFLSPSMLSIQLMLFFYFHKQILVLEYLS